jgi:hypothetical protein
MINFNNDFLGYKPNTVLKFCGSDTEELYHQNLKTKPADWYYRTADISYEYNSFGHRCKNLNDIDLDNYILFSGCSYVEGIGLELKKTFPHIVSDELGTDYYNLGVGGSGIDVMTYNLVTWFSKVKKLPKAVVIMWTFEERFATWSFPEHRFKFNIPNMTDENTARFMSLGQQLDYFKTKKNLNSRSVKQLYSETNIIELETSALTRYDVARDLHPGIMSHQILAKKINNAFK